MNCFISDGHENTSSIVKTGNLEGNGILHPEIKIPEKNGLTREEDEKCREVTSIPVIR